MSSKTKKEPNQTIRDRLETRLRREPFRPFRVTLDNGLEITFEEARELGVPVKLDVIFYFSPEGGATEIDKHAVRTVEDIAKD